MTAIYPWLLGALLLLLLSLAAGLVRVLLGPGLRDRMLAVQLLGSGGVAVLMLLAVLLDLPSLLDVSLVLALLAVVAAAALTRREVSRD
jgi:multicomponent Na+:H+ antiporter subunit F